MKKTLVTMATLMLTAGALAGCGDDDGDGGDVPSTTPAAVAAPGTSPSEAPGAETTADTQAPPPDTTPPETVASEVTPAGMTLYAPAFEDGATIPVDYTCDGSNDTPEIRFDRTPPETVSLALTVIDPDGGDWIHWVAWNIPPGAGGLPAGTPGGDLPNGTRQGVNDFGDLLATGDTFARGDATARVDGWDGPCPPRGVHRYVFTLYAMAATIDLPSGAPGPAVLEAIEAARAGGILLAETSLTGLYPSG